MASGNFISSTGTNLNLYVTWSSTTNVETNKSNVTAKVYMRSSTISGSALSDSYITINGNKKSFAGKSLTKTSSAITDTLLVEHTVSIDHNSDGKKSITIKANLEFNGTVSGKYLSDVTASKTVDLDVIPRSSGLTVAASINTGSSLTATISPASSTFTHKVAYIIGGTTKFTSDTIAAGTKTYSYTIPHSWLPSSNETNMIVRLFTYSGTTQIGSVDKTVYVTVPSTVVPTVNTITATIVNGLGGYYVEGKSQVKLTVSATAGSGSTLSSYTFSGQNINGTSSTLTTTNNVVTSIAINLDGSLKYGVIAKDQRPSRQSTKKEVAITVYPYAAPQITSITAQRCKSDGTIDSNGTYAKVTVKTSYSSVNGANKRVVKLYSSKDSYATGTVVLAETNTSNTYTGVYGSGFATSSSYTIKAVITDAYTTGETVFKTATLRAAERTLNIAKYGNGVSVGGLSSQTTQSASGLFETHWPINMYQGGKCNGFIDFTSIGSQDGLRFEKYDTDNNLTRSVKLYKGDSNVQVGLWDSTTEKAVWQYRTLDDGTDELYINQPTKVNNTINALRGRFTATTDASGTTQANVALRIGGDSGLHIDIDANEIQAKDGETTPSVLNLNYDGGDVVFGKDIIARVNNYGYRGTRTDGKQVNLIRINASNEIVIGELSSGVDAIQITGVYNNTVSSAANMFIDSNQRVFRSSSSSNRYKTDIKNIQSEDLKPEKLYDLPVREFKYKEGYLSKEDPRIDTFVPGFIAEEVAEVYPIACEYDGDKPENWNIRFMVPAMLKLIQDQKKEIDALKELIGNKEVNV